MFIAVYGNWPTMLVKLLIEGLHISLSSLCGREMQSQTGFCSDKTTGVITPLG